MDKTELRDSVTIKDPQIHETAFIAPGAHVVGDVILKKDSSIWYNTVARADINQIIIGERTNVQDNSVIHLENDQGVIIGNDVTIGHNAIIHGCTIEDGALIGMGAVIMNGATIGRGAVVGAGAVVKENMLSWLASTCDIKILNNLLSYLKSFEVFTFPSFLQGLGQ